MNSHDLEKDLAALQPKTKIGKLRKYLPMIEQKLSDGVTAQEVIGLLKSHGIELSEGTFRYYLHQFRKSKKSGNASLANPQTEKKGLAMSAQELSETMQPDHVKLEQSIAEKERLYKQSLKKAHSNDQV